MWSSFIKYDFLLVLFCSFFKIQILFSKLTCFAVVFKDIFLILLISFLGLSFHATHSNMFSVWYYFFRKLDSSIWIFIEIKSWFRLSHNLSFFILISKHVFYYLNAHLAPETLVHILVLRSSLFENFSLFLLRIDLAFHLLFSWSRLINLRLGVIFRILTHLVSSTSCLNFKPLIGPSSMLPPIWASSFSGRLFIAAWMGLWN